MYPEKRKTAWFRVILMMMTLLSAGLLGQIYMEKHLSVYERSLRFHVRASSDASLEQSLKLSVRDAVLNEIHGDAARASDAGELKRLLENRQQEIRESALSCLKKRGYPREVRVYFTRERFPVRRYGSVLFPAGMYQAMRVDIGGGKGHNWWCALFPQLCYNNGEYHLSGKGEQELKELFSFRKPTGGSEK